MIWYGMIGNGTITMTPTTAKLRHGWLRGLGHPSPPPSSETSARSPQAACGASIQAAPSDKDPCPPSRIAAVGGEEGRARSKRGSTEREEGKGREILPTTGSVQPIQLWLTKSNQLTACLSRASQSLKRGSSMTSRRRASRRCHEARFRSHPHRIRVCPLATANQAGP